MSLGAATFSIFVIGKNLSFVVLGEKNKNSGPYQYGRREENKHSYMGHLDKTGQFLNMNNEQIAN